MNGSRTISFVNLGGGNVTSLVVSMLKTIPRDAKAIIVEFPCSGIPKMSYAFGQIRIEKEKTIDQLLLDYDRNMKKAVDDYIVKTDEADLLMINPRALPEIPTIRKVESNKTLIDMPLYLKLQLENRYDYVFYVLQGMLIHPMTHFALRCSDHIVLHSSDPLEFVTNYTNYKKLNDIFAIPKNRMSIYSNDSNLNFSEEKIITSNKELMKQISNGERQKIEFLPEAKETKLNNENIGIIDPIDFLDYKFQSLDVSTEISQDDAKNLEDLTTSVRYYIQKNHLDDFVRGMLDDECRQKVRYFISDYIREQTDLTFSMNINEVIEWVQKEITELGVLQKILDDPKITSIEINAPDQVIVEENGITRHAEEVKFQNTHHLYQTLNKILMPIGQPISSSEPIVDANYKGFRINVIADKKEYEGISARFPLVSIRKFPPAVYSDEDCIKYGNISDEISKFLNFIVPCGANIIIAGGTNSGKTSQLIRLPLYVDRLTRILSIEDTEEMMLASKTQYKDYPNLPSLIVKDVEDKDKSYGMDKLIKAALRQNPVVIVIGEVRDEPAAKQGLIAMNTGHVVWETLHANSAKDAATRILQLNGNTLAAASQIGSSVDLIIFQKKLKNGVRVVTEICELLGYRGTEEPILNPIFSYDALRKRHVRVGNISSEAMLKKIELQELPEEEVMKWCNPGEMEEGCA